MQNRSAQNRQNLRSPWADLFGEEAVPEKAQRERIVYVNPDDPTQTCSNYGRKPEWFKKLRDEGREIPRLQ